MKYVIDIETIKSLDFENIIINDFKEEYEEKWLRKLLKFLNKIDRKEDAEEVKDFAKWILYENPCYYSKKTDKFEIKEEAIEYLRMQAIAVKNRDNKIKINKKKELKHKIANILEEEWFSQDEKIDQIIREVNKND